MSESDKPPIINCHTHIFTGDHVPPFLAKSILPYPFYKLANFQFIFRKFRNYYEKGEGRRRNTGGANDRRARKYFRSMWIERHPAVKFPLYAIGWYLTFQAVDILLHWSFGGPEDAAAAGKWYYRLHHTLEQYYALLDPKGWWWQLLIVAVVITFFKSGRNLLVLVVKNIFSFLKKIPGKETKQLFERYLTIGRYAFHRQQRSTLNQLENQYPEGSGFVILPMDMEYMEAGKPAESYLVQMDKLAVLKNGRKEGPDDDDTEEDQEQGGDKHLYPFVFVDPRRIAAEADYFQYTVNENGEIVLKDCFIKRFIEEEKFSGFKIYPALGYYPFDPLLLPLWKYAQQKQLPIMTHCVRGPMYFRGKKSKDWDEHPVFLQKTAGGNGKWKPLLLPEKKNDQFSANFTHPLNYACLLKKEFFADYLNHLYQKDSAKYGYLKEMFGLVPSNDLEVSPTVENNLEQLKICFGHYGGNDEWNRYFELDRFSHSNQLAQVPDFGINMVFFKGSKTKRSFGKQEQLWRNTDWYSIISSLILQHENVYADVSYILHSDAQILPLLKQTLENTRLRSKVLYGTDFFVVRNHKSDKNMLADMMGGLSERDFDQIARFNPQAFLKNTVV